MRTYDLSPLYRATVGFDRMADLLDRVLTQDTAPSTYPPYNIEKTADDAYRISIAVAGFTEAELSVEQREAELVVAARKGKGRRRLAPTCIAASPRVPLKSASSLPTMSA
jgi:molecular chaperone IbpA